MKTKNALTIVPVFNEKNIIGGIIDRLMKPAASACDILIVDDCSNDGTYEAALQRGINILRHDKRMGCGPSVRSGIDYALRNGYEVAVVMAGNGKDSPEEIPRLLAAIQQERCDFVQGSRYLRSGEFTNMPSHRIWGTKLYSALFSLLINRRITDGTNGFRAVRLSIFKDKRINIWQDWLCNYEVESYLFYKALALGYKFKEVPVSKTYPADLKKGYTKVRPVVDWWSHFRPILFLALGIKK